MDKTTTNILLIGGCVVIFILLIALIYMIIAYRKIGIVAKKIDYLVEDLTYKSEMLTPTIDALVKLSNYIDLFESFINQSSDSFARYVSNNRESSFKFVNKLKEVIKDA
ncbi:MAG: hypothetical protein LBV37_01430 [Mycoplasmataceae bacterium]|jgi:predicted PurR-regulated permease PerM|nr:hypothetical protein [Mycoplasmataceae bacterium]